MVLPAPEKRLLLVKAHVGEFDGADNVMRYAEELKLNQIQHGIRAVESQQIMQKYRALC